MTLNNGYGLITERNGRHIVEAMFRGSLEIVFEGINRKECINYCHTNGMKAMDKDAYIFRTNPWFIKKNAKHPFNPDEWSVGTVNS